MSGILLDTCAAIWLAEGEGLSMGAQQTLADVLDTGANLAVSPITAWEVGQLNARGRLALRQSPLSWFRALVGLPGMELSPLSADILVASSFLPGDPPRDPADRIIAATCREIGLRLMTRDGLLLDYAEAGHLDAVPC